MYRILITGVGAIIGYGIIKTIKMSCFNAYIVGCDIYEDAVGQKWCNKFYQAIPSASDTYISFLTDLIEKEKIDLVFFGTEQEILKCATETFSYRNICVLNNRFLIHLAQDKWDTHCYLKEHFFQTIPTFIEGSYEDLSAILGNKLLLKPRNSYASKGIVEVSSKEEFIFWKKKMGTSFMAQQIVGNKQEEYTASIFGYGDGTSTNCICLRRKLGQDGATWIAEVCANETIFEEVGKLTKLLKPVGPTNYQFRIHQGNAMLLEINPRISSATSIRAIFGFNEAELCIKFWMECTKQTALEIRKGKAVRYIADLLL